jgi:hypothetical protein
MHSIAIETVTGSTNPPLPAKALNCCYRFLINRNDIKAGSATSFFLSDGFEKSCRVFPDIKNQRRFVYYPCRE